MTRTDVMASSRPRTADAKTDRKGSSRGLRRRSILPAMLAVCALALAPAAASAAEEPTSSYTTTTPKPTTTTTTPSSGALPSKESEKPASEPAPSNTSTTPKASTLPFTGFDLRWDVGFGLLLVVAGASIVAVQRRQRDSGGR
jgi:hypothetical protein